MVSYAILSKAGGLHPKQRKKRVSQEPHSIFNVSHALYALVLMTARLHRGVCMEEKHPVCTTNQRLLLLPSAAAEHHGKHHPFWKKPSSEVKPQAGLLAAHTFTCLPCHPQAAQEFPLLWDF